MPQTDDERKILWIWLKDIFKFSDVKVFSLVEIFGSAENIYKADSNDFKNIKGLLQKEINMLCAKDLSRAQKTYENALKSGTDIILMQEDRYPYLLKQIYQPPPVLYVKGNIECVKDRLVIAGVGTRKCDDMSAKIMTNIACDLAKAGIVIVSGMAKGIDSAAHRGALAAGGITAAVLGTAIDKIYPAENRELYYNITESGGAVISEHPPGYYGFKSDFVRRNRIIAGLSHGVLVCRAPVASGSLTTARAALDFGRDTFCVPGDATAENEGSNRLIMDGCAKMILSAKDIIEEYAQSGVYYNFSPEKIKEQEIKKLQPLDDKADKIQIFEKNKEEGKYEALDENQRKVVMYVKDKRILSEDICQALGMDAKVLSAMITELEIDDILTNDNGYISLNI